MRIIIGGGGTAGHLIPGIALSKELKKQGYEILYVLRSQDLAYNISSQLDPEEYITVSLTNISRNISLNTVKQLFSILKAWISVFKKLYVFKPDVMVITGGYVSNIVALSALVMRKPLYILEQNSVSGITNRFWAKFAKKVFSAFPFPEKIAKNKIYFTGNPLLYNQILSVEESKSILGLSNDQRKVIGITGGSQGAQVINNMVLNILPILIEQGYQVVWSLGTKEYERLSTENKLTQFTDEHFHDSVRIFRFVDRMDAFWSVSDVVLARAGAGTVSEAALFHTPVLFIPIYNSPDNHQYYNAKFLADEGCCCIIEEPALKQEMLLAVLLQMVDAGDELKSKFPVSAQNPVKLIAEYITSL